jgi:hypothetical protein
MPAYSSAPYTLGENEYLDGKSLFHWCPNTHLHSRCRMYTLKVHAVDSWGKPYTWHKGWYCPECHIFEERIGSY